VPRAHQPLGCGPSVAEGELHPKKKTLHADERDRPDVREARAAFRVEQQRVDPSTRVFVDEFGINLDLTRRYARAPRGARAVGSVPGSTRGNITLVFGLGARKILAPRLLRGAMTGEDFLFYADHVLGPCLHRGDVVVTDRLGAHRSSAVAEAIERRGARIQLLPPYSPDLTPVENCGSKVKTALRKAAARSWDALVDAVAIAIRSVTPDDIYGWLRHAGFRPKLE
jgi:transposase